MEPELPREAYRLIFRSLDAEIARLVANGLTREQACDKVACCALARQAESAQEKARAKAS